MPRKPKDTSQSNTDPDLVVEALDWYADLRGKIASLQQSIATGLTRYEKQGVDKVALKLAYKLQSSDMTPTEIAAQRAREQHYLQWAGVITIDATGQSSMVSALEPKRPSAVAARKLELGRIQTDAYNSGRAAGSRDDCPHEPGSEQYAVWIEWFDKGQTDVSEEAEKAKLPPLKRGRPRKAAGASGNGAGADAAPESPTPADARPGWRGDRDATPPTAAADMPADPA
jgi:hypothetical protein